MNAPRFPYIAFNQYGDAALEDDLLLFSAPARTIAAWAGVPRKGWHIRMLFQRPVSDQRRSDLREFWRAASTPDRGKGETLIRGPNAITVAIQGAPLVENGQIILEPARVIDFNDRKTTNIQRLASLILPKVKSRLNDEQKSILEDFSVAPKIRLPDVDNDYVFEFALQLVQMQFDPEWFLSENNILEQDQVDLVASMEAITRSAVVVDGQHRLLGAADFIEKDVLIPVVALPNSDWGDQVYQFVVVNETAKRVDSSVLTDIFGSSLTKEEQKRLRSSLDRVGIKIDPRIAAVTADRDEDSPFRDMIQIRLDGTPPGGGGRFLSEMTIRLLVEGGRGARGWRKDTEFYEKCVSSIIDDPAQWDSYANGKWRPYWYAFWSEVGQYYNEQARLLKSRETDTDLWRKDRQTNLTKAVSLRCFQSLFMNKAIARLDGIEPARQILIETLGAEQASSQIARMQRDRAVAPTPEEFRRQVRSWFLENGVPVRFFTANWKSSLDDSEGQLRLYEAMETAWDRTQRGERWHATGQGVFEHREDVG